MGQSLLDKLFSAGNQTPADSAMHSDPIMAQVVIDNISDGIAIVNQQGLIQLFNPAAELLTGWKSSDAVNLDYRSVFNLLNSAERPLPDIENPIVKALSTRSSTSSENVYILTASKRRIQISIKVSPITKQDAANNATIEGLAIVFRDITRERAEQNAQTDFISTASHEMRTPVATIEGYLGMILNPKICQIDDRARDYAKKSHDAIIHLGRLFQDLLDVTKADDSRLNLRPILVDAKIAAEQITDSFKDKAAKKNLTLSFKGGNTSDHITPPSIIYVDIDRLDEILSNMIENAIKYTSSGEVSVSIVHENNRVRINVTDSGIGIPAEDLPHLFQKFYRVDNSETREIGGTGLGLYLIKKLATSMDGSVGVDSVYGKGSTFWVEFDNLTREQAYQKAVLIKQRDQKNQTDQLANTTGSAV